MKRMIPVLALFVLGAMSMMWLAQADYPCNTGFNLRIDPKSRNCTTTPDYLCQDQIPNLNNQCPKGSYINAFEKYDLKSDMTQPINTTVIQEGTLPPGTVGPPNLQYKLCYTTDDCEYFLDGMVKRCISKNTPVYHNVPKMVEVRCVVIAVPIPGGAG